VTSLWTRWVVPIHDDMMMCARDHSSIVASEVFINSALGGSGTSIPWSLRWWPCKERQVEWVGRALVMSERDVYAGLVAYCLH
jgi:hypothetical protein